jgi:hypothetical protein
MRSAKGKRALNRTAGSVTLALGNLVERCIVTSITLCAIRFERCARAP